MGAVVLDHLVVACDTLAQGAAWCESTFGVASVAGGRHATMGTHNRLLNLSSPEWPQLYLELIAIDPEAEPPPHPRWFGLDDGALRDDLRAHGPRLVHAVARSTMLDMHRWGLITVGETPGDPVDFERGAFRWQMLVRRDGGLGAGGALPTLLQWKGAHPADSLPASGVRLASLTLAHVPRRAREVLRLRGVAFRDEAGAPALAAVMSSPAGDVTIDSNPRGPR